jgi:hypothetical protein
VLTPAARPPSLPSDNPPERAVLPRLPVVLVAARTPSLDAARATAELAKLDVVDGWALPAEPWDVAPDGVVVRGRCDDDAVESELVDAVARGAGAIVGIDREQPGASRLIDALMRTAPVLDWIDCPLMTLGADQLLLLHALADGRSTRAAAHAAHLSERTGHRRIAAARFALGIESTNEAAAEVDAVVQLWSEARLRHPDGLTPPTES